MIFLVWTIYFNIHNVKMIGMRKRKYEIMEWVWGSTTIFFRLGLGVVIAHDVDPVELVVWLPALCRKMNIPYAIVKGKSRLGTLVHKKNTAVVALTTVNKEDDSKLGTLQENFRTQFNNNVVRKWGGGQMGLKTVAKLEKRRKQVEAEQKKIQAALK